LCVPTQFTIEHGQIVKTFSCLGMLWSQHLHMDSSCLAQQQFRLGILGTNPHVCSCHEQQPSCFCGSYLPPVNKLCTRLGVREIALAQRPGGIIAIGEHSIDGLHCTLCPVTLL